MFSINVHVYIAIKHNIISDVVTSSRALEKKNIILSSHISMTSTGHMAHVFMFSPLKFQIKTFDSIIDAIRSNQWSQLE